jgi:hypothetical protein
MSFLPRFSCALLFALCSLSPISSLDDFRTLVVQKLLIAIGAEELDFLVPQLLPVTIELAFSLRAGRPEYFGHGASWYQRNKIRNPNIERGPADRNKPHEGESEIRSTKSETNRGQINSKSENPKQ